MTTREHWLALAERCEKATGPDREIDEAIAFMVRFRPESGTMARYSFDRHEAKHDYATAWIAHSFFRQEWGIPVWTTSIDAITTLIEQELPGYGIASQRAPDGGFAKASIFPDGGYGGPRAVAATEALARCAAFCRAKAELAGDA